MEDALLDRFRFKTHGFAVLFPVAYVTLKSPSSDIKP
jgi:hypothetical protein